MKRKFVVAMLAFAALVFAGCHSPTSSSSSGSSSNSTSGSTSTTDSAKINFEGTSAQSTYISNGGAYNPGTALTAIDTSATPTIDTTTVYAGTQSLKVAGTSEQDKYDYSSGTTFNSPPKTTELGIRLKAATITNSGTAFDMTDRLISLHVYVPTGGTNTSLQFVLQDSSSQQAISPAVTVTAGQWNSIYFKADSTRLNSSSKLLLTNTDSTGAFVTTGAYSSATFDATNISEFEIRSLGTAAGTAATFYVDSIDWGNSAASTTASQPSFSLNGGTSSTASASITGNQSLTLSSLTSGASIYYTETSDGSTPADPTTSSTLYSSAITLTAPSSATTTYTIKAIAVKSGLSSSSVSSVTLTSSPAALPTPATGSTTNTTVSNWYIGPEDTTAYKFKQYTIPAITTNTWTHVTIDVSTATVNYDAGITVSQVTAFRLMGVSSGTSVSNFKFYIANLKVTQGSTTLYTQASQPTSTFYNAAGTFTADTSTSSSYLGELVATATGGDLGSNYGFEAQWSFPSALTTETGMIYDFYIYVPTTY